MPQPRNQPSFTAEALLAVAHDPKAFEDKLAKFMSAKQDHDAAYERAAREKNEAKEILANAERVSTETRKSNEQDMARIEKGRRSLEQFREKIDLRNAAVSEKEKDLAARYALCNTREIELDSRASHLDAMKQALDGAVAELELDRSSLASNKELHEKHRDDFESKRKQIMDLLKAIS